MDFEISAAYIDTPENTEGKFPTPRAKKKARPFIQKSDNQA